MPLTRSQSNMTTTNPTTPTNTATVSQSSTSNASNLNVFAGGESIHSMSDIRSLISQDYHGDRNKLYDFLQDCGQAWALCNAPQRVLMLSYIESKLKGPAKAQTRLKKFNNFEQLRDTLIQLFGDRRSFTQLLEELSSLQQNKNEQIQQFFNRIEHIQTLALNKVCLQDELEHVGRTAMINEIALQRLIHHSIEEISSVLRRCKLNNLNDALQEALNEEQHLNRRKTYPPRYNVPQKFCDYCKKPGHVLRDCRRKSVNLNENSRARYQTPINVQNTYTHRPGNQEIGNKFCRYCKKPGHLIDECRKLQYKKTLQNQNQPSANVALNKQTSAASVETTDV